MKDDFYYIELFEIYNGLLTEVQRQKFSEHFLLDLSYAETAEGSGASRQSVYDAVKKVKIKLDEFEGKLKIKARSDRLKKIAEGLDEQTKNKILSNL